MSSIHIERKNDLITVSRISESEPTLIWKKSIHELIFKETEDTNIPVNEDDRYRVFLWENINENVLLIYSKATQIKCLLTTENGAFLRLIDRSNKVLSASITPKKLTIKWFGAIRNKFNLNISNFRLHIDEKNFVKFDMPVSKKLLNQEAESKKKYITTFEYPADQLIYENAAINCRLYITMQVNDIEVSFPLKLDDTAKTDHPTLISSIFYKDHVLHLRRSFLDTITLVRRPMEPVEHTLKFRFLENPKISNILYSLGKKYKENNKKKINLFYEKFAEKAEEGTFEVFQEALKNPTTKSYFVIHKKSSDYKKIRNYKNIVKKFSFRYYWLLYRTSSFISTESPNHINIIRSNNNCFRTIMKEVNFIFLQHGITYLKCHGRFSPFLAGKESEPTYMFVGSEKEKHVISQMLELPAERILKTGLPIFSKLTYKHLNQDSKDIVVIMLTWKPYEEYLSDFEQSSYFKNIKYLFEILQKNLQKEDIIIVAHPKVNGQLSKTSFGKNIWNRPISEALAVAKLLITDYSSACYNSFYQGGGVIFFQEDLELYEEVNGKLIPEDHEYIGHRAFSFKELETLLNEGIKDHKIILSKFRTEEFEKRYLTINEFCDGKNVQRICEELKKLDII